MAWPWPEETFSGTSWPAEPPVLADTARRSVRRESWDCKNSPERGLWVPCACGAGIACKCALLELYLFCPWTEGLPVQEHSKMLFMNDFAGYM